MATACLEETQADAGRTDLQPVQNDIPLEVSARHVHLTQGALESLFGAGATLGQRRALSQPGEFLSDRRVKLVTSKGEIDGVAVLGPVRGAVQVELSRSDCRKLGLDAPVRLSGDLSGAADVKLQSTTGNYMARGAVIVARNHIHCTPAEAKQLGIAEGQAVNVWANTSRPLIFKDVLVRVHESFALAMHIDTDEANACMLESGLSGSLCGPYEEKVKPCVEAKPTIITDKVITEARAKELAAQGHVVMLPKGTILTPSAKDVFLHRHIKIECV
ncbi:MAG: phosphate propanoyltransferase [Oscillospiraceae bacterium]|nr:phosphate propanoyltransferase [Oscillospiraceae bacterium]